MRTRCVIVSVACLAGLSLVSGCDVSPRPPSPQEQRPAATIRPSPQGIAQRDPETGATLSVAWDAANLHISLEGLGRIATNAGDRHLYVATRFKGAPSGPTLPPKSQSMAQPPAFRWNLITANPLPYDGVNANPSVVHVLHLPDGQQTAALQTWKGSQADDAWKEAGPVHPDASSIKGAAIHLALPWERLAHPPRVLQADDYFDLIVLLYNNDTGETELAFPIENGNGPNVLLSYVFSYPPVDSPDRPARAVNSAETDFSSDVLQEEFDSARNAWVEMSLPEPGQGGGSQSVSNGMLSLVLTAPGSFGLCCTQTVSGTFETQVELTLDEGAACGLMLFKDNGGKPDPSSFLCVERTYNDQGERVVRVRAQRRGETMVEEWWQQKLPHFEYALGSQELGREARAVRVIRDERSGCLRLSYRYQRQVDGKLLEGWMEFPTLADWDKRPCFVCPYVRSLGGERVQARFDHLLLRNIRRDDADERNGFAVVQRPYAFSGVSGDAVVITFGEEFPFRDKARFVFWSEANFIPWWHLDDKCAVSYEFCEIWGGGTTWKGQTPGGCCEPMSDRLLRWSNVEIVEENDVRVVVRWEYVLANPEYQWWGRHPAKRPFVEEWYCFYRDGTGIRRLTYYPVTETTFEPSWNEISELMVVNRGGVLPSECLSRAALSMLNLQGERRDYTYLTGPPQYIGEETKDWDEAIVRVNLNHRPGVFEVFAQGEGAFRKTFPGPYNPDWWGRYGNEWHVERKGGYEYEGDFWPFSHWPISKIPYEDHTKSNGRYIREPGHTSIMGVPGHPGARSPTTWAMLVGLSAPGDDEDLRRRASSWVYPGTVKELDASSRFVENDYYQRALVFETTLAPACHFSLTPGPVVVNPVVIVRNWGTEPPAVYLNDALLGPDRFKHAFVEGQLLLWIKATLWSETNVRIEPQGARISSQEETRRACSSGGGPACACSRHPCATDPQDERDDESLGGKLKLQLLDAAEEMSDASPETPWTRIAASLVPLLGAVFGIRIIVLHPSTLAK